jgi:hypothetical protein
MIELVSGMPAPIQGRIFVSVRFRAARIRIA